MIIARKREKFYAGAGLRAYAGIGPYHLPIHIRQYRIILSADTASEVRQMLSQSADNTLCIIEHFGNADAVPQPPERCLSRQAGIVRCCHNIKKPTGKPVGFKNYEIVTRGSQLRCTDPRSSCGVGPAEVALHGAVDQHGPTVLLPVAFLGAPAGLIQLVGVVVGKGEAVAEAVAGIVDGVTQAAGRRGQRGWYRSGRRPSGRDRRARSGKASGRCQHRSRSPGPVWR